MLGFLGLRRVILIGVPVVSTEQAAAYKLCLIIVLTHFLHLLLSLFDFLLNRISNFLNLTIISSMPLRLQQFPPRLAAIDLAAIRSSRHRAPLLLIGLALVLVGLVAGASDLLAGAVLVGAAGLRYFDSGGDHGDVVGILDATEIHVAGRGADVQLLRVLLGRDD